MLVQHVMESCMLVTDQQLTRPARAAIAQETLSERRLDDGRGGHAGRCRLDRARETQHLPLRGPHRYHVVSRAEGPVGSWGITVV